MVVQSLIGQNSLSFYENCLSSWLTHCKEDIRLLIHSDGSLQGRDRDEALNRLGEKAAFANPHRSKEQTLDHLSGRPYCQAIRRDSLWGIEFFDPLFAYPDEPISFYLDADILFLRPFSGLFDRSQVEGSAVFLKDTQWNAYSLRPWHLLGWGKRPTIVKGITTALVYWDKRAIDWDYLEWFLGQTQYHRIPEWILPTAQAGLASRCQAKTVSDTQVLNLYPNAKITEQTFGVHLLGSYRQQWLSKVEQFQQKASSTTSTVQAKFQPCKPCNTLSYTGNQIKRWVNTRLNRW